MSNPENNAPIFISGDVEIAFPDRVHVLPCDDPIVFPSLIAPIVIDDDNSRELVEEALKGKKLLALFPTNPVANGNGEEEEERELAQESVGTLCAVLRILKIPDGSLRVLVHGVTRITLDEILEEDPHTIARVKRIDEVEVMDLEVEALMKQALLKLQRIIQLTSMPEDLSFAAMNVEEGGKLADLIASNLSLKPEQLRAVLSEINPKKRLTSVFRILSREVTVLEIGSDISDKVRESVDKNQREFFLREQMKALQTELGESDPHEQELKELRDRLEKKELPEYAREVAEREMGRLSLLQPAAAEYSVIRTYLDWILDIPWNEATDDHLDLVAAAQILDEDHYGLEKVKERILEFLAVIRLKGGSLKGPILCLVGPPGVGKTSLGRSIARATGRKFARFSVGGIRDEAEIRGHRRTYIGAMPGRVVKSLKDCGTVNPLIMLDEIDKLGMDFRGDPASALLEVLDPEQNDTFTDHYMDMPVDLSRVMFITTANSLDTVPGPLRDRMEIIRIAGYVPSEKLEIARRFLVPRELDNSGLTKKDIAFRAPAIRRIITDYTVEAGVRGLQKQIGSICRKTARKIAEAESVRERAKRRRVIRRKQVVVDQSAVEEFLGAPKNYQEVAGRMGRPGVAIGLAWTPVGGDILFTEANCYPGKGDLKLTGQLGDVMKESAQAAMTFLRSELDLLGVEDSEFASHDFHIHVPEGATPKDGPSAGVTMVTTLASLVTGRPVRDYLAMTGEVTLRGAILPVGGIKEKCLAAHRAGIREIILPKRNERDLDEIPEPIRKKMKFHLMERVEDLLDVALTPARKRRQSMSK